jgi:hypothetical protein
MAMYVNEKVLLSATENLNQKVCSFVASVEGFRGKAGKHAGLFLCFFDFLHTRNVFVSAEGVSDVDSRISRFYIFIFIQCNTLS